MTAYATGTATDAADFVTQLTTFLTTNSDLVSASQAWTSEWTSGADTVLKGPGLSGTDNVLVGLRLINDGVNSDYRLMIEGMTGVLSGATELEGHVNPSSLVGMYLDSNPFTYWFVASGRRFVAVAQISTVFEAVYGGFMLPYATPDQYPYPLFVGGSRAGNVSSTNTWRSVADEHTHFSAPAYDDSNSGAYLLDSANIWRVCANRGSPPYDYVVVGPDYLGTGYGVFTSGDITQQGTLDFHLAMRDTFGGGYPLTPITLASQISHDITYGILDGCYHVPGFSNSAANIVTVSGLDHLVVQNAFRSNLGDFWALGLG
jgi:hypothetical protein